MTRDKVKTIAIEMVKKEGLINLSRRKLCENANIPDGSFPHVMGCNFSEFVKELGEEDIVQNMVPVSKSRVPAALRKEHILNVATNMAVKIGYTSLTRDGVAEAAGVSFSLVSKHFGTMVQLKREVMRTAIKREILEIIAQGLVNGDDRALKAPEEVKIKASNFIANLC